MAGIIITVAQQKGGCGKTTLTAHLAVAGLLRPNAEVAVLDVDPQGSLGEWFEAREKTLGEDHTGLTFRTASGWGARREARALARDHALVVVDTPPKSDTEARPAIEAANLVAVPMQPTPVDLWATEATLLLAAKERVPAVIVMNRVPPRAALTQEVESAMANLSSPATKARLGNRTAYAASMGEGRTVVETATTGKAADEVRALAQEIFAQTGWA